MEELNSKLKSSTNTKLLKTPKNKLNDGFCSVNGKDYSVQFKEINKYGERTFVFRRFHTEYLMGDIEKGNFSSISNYIEEFSLLVIEDEMYEIEEIVFVFEKHQGS